MDLSGDRGGGLTATELCCGSCGVQLSATAKFCSECGAPAAKVSRSAEYKQVTVLFADVVHSMDIAATVGAERLREIMAELADRCASVVQRYGGTVDKFTGDGIMAVFGAPVALEDHATRACLAALGVQEEAQRLALDVRERDGVDLQVRVGLNSGEVIAGEIGSGPFGYTAVGEQVGMAQRMESAAPPGGVMLSVSTARLVRGAATLGEAELVQIKGADEPVAAQRLLGIGEGHQPGGRAESHLVGRRWEMSAVEGLLERAIEGHGAVVSVVGPPGIGKSRLVREVAALARQQGVEVFTTFCESHTSQVPFHAVARLFRTAIGVEGLDAPAARAAIRGRGFDAESEDLMLFEDLLGIGDPEAEHPRIDPDARRRRLTALVNAASLANETPAVYVVEDAHWIDESSESMLADFLTVIPQTPLLTIITYRPEYRGALAQVVGAQTIALAPLSDSETAALLSELLGPDPSVGELGQTVAERAAGTPFFVEEIVRELAEQGVLQGTPGAYISTVEAAEVNVPGTLQATIAARIDRLSWEAKRTLGAAAVIGSRFGLDLLTVLVVEPVIDELVAGQFVDQVRFTRQPEYVFHHPLIRAVAYESQLKSDRAQLHRRVADTIEQEDQNAALLAEHLEAAGDLRAAFDWHMRAGAWFHFRDIAAAHTSWRRALHVADRLPENDPQRSAMRIAPRTLLVGTAWRVAGTRLDIDFEELRELCTDADDRQSLAIGMAGFVTTMTVNGDDSRETSRRATELMELLESIGDSTLTLAMCFAPLIAKHWTGESVEGLRFAQRSIDAAEGDATRGALVGGSPLAMAILMRGVARYSLGHAGWKADIHDALAMADRVGELMARVGIRNYAYVEAILDGVLASDASVLQDAAETLATTEKVGDDFQLLVARLTRGVNLIHHHGGAERAAGLELLTGLREAAEGENFPNPGLVPLIDISIAKEHSRLGDIDGAVDRCRTVIDGLFARRATVWTASATAVLVEALLCRGSDSDLAEARAAIDRLAAVPTDPGYVIHEIWLLRLRALLIRAHGDEGGYRNYRDRYREMARSLGFEGHIAWAEAMP